MRLMMCDFFDMLTPEILILLCFFHPSLLVRGYSYVVIVSRLQGVKNGLWQSFPSAEGLDITRQVCKFDK